MAKKTRTDLLRRRPQNIRYFYLAVTDTTIHTGASWGGLNYIRKKYKINTLVLADVNRGIVKPIPESTDAFMSRWLNHYEEPEWDYFKEVK